MHDDLKFLLEAVAIGGALALGMAGCGDSGQKDTATVTGCPTAACPTSACPTTACPTTACPTGGCPTAACPTVAGDAQTPAQGYAAVTAWIEGGDYLDWTCEPAPHDPRSPSPHGPNRICSNDLLSAHGAGEYPVGSASVKELYDASSTNIVGYAVALHTTAGTEGGDWYWYEVVPLDSAAPHGPNGVVADGTGESGTPMTICVSCHAGAGSDSGHSGHDMVYTQVQ